jgi:chemotaxis signal transduction protein
MSRAAAPNRLGAHDIRAAFDRSFAQPPQAARAKLRDVLAIRLNEDPYLIDLEHLAGVFADKAITGLPHSEPGFLGIAGFRGALVPVYDLRVLLGYKSGKAPRWLAVASASRVALAFDQMEGLRRVPRAHFAQQAHSEGARPHVRELVGMAASETPRALIDLNSVAASLEQGTRQLPHP